MLSYIYWWQNVKVTMNTFVFHISMDEVHQSILRHNLVALCNELDVNLIINNLIQEDVLTFQEWDVIQLKPLKTERARDLVTLLVRKQTSVFDSFMRSLKGPHKHLYELLLAGMKAKGLPTDHLEGKLLYDHNAEH